MWTLRTNSHCNLSSAVLSRAQPTINNEHMRTHRVSPQLSTGISAKLRKGGGAPAIKHISARAAA